MNTQQKKVGDKVYYSLEEMCEKTSLSKYFFRKHIAEGNLKYYKFGKGFKLTLEDVEALMDLLHFTKG